MAEIVKRSKALSVNPLKVSQPVGASLAFLGVQRAIPKSDRLLPHGETEVSHSTPRTTPMPHYQLGDLVYAAYDLYNDAVEETGESGIPGIEPGELLVAASGRGVVVNVGQVEAAPGETIYLVRFELDAEGVLSEPFGCLEDELVPPPEPT